MTFKSQGNYNRVQLPLSRYPFLATVNSYYMSCLLGCQKSLLLIGDLRAHRCYISERVFLCNCQEEEKEREGAVFHLSLFLSLQIIMLTVACLSCCYLSFSFYFVFVPLFSFCPSFPPCVSFIFSLSMHSQFSIYTKQSVRENGEKKNTPEQRGSVLLSNCCEDQCVTNESERIRLPNLVFAITNTRVVYSFFSFWTISSPLPFSSHFQKQYQTPVT